MKVLYNSEIAPKFTKFITWFSLIVVSLGGAIGTLYGGYLGVKVIAVNQVDSVIAKNEKVEKIDQRTEKLAKSDSLQTELLNKIWEQVKPEE